MKEVSTLLPNNQDVVDEAAEFGGTEVGFGSATIAIHVIGRFDDIIGMGDIAARGTCVFISNEENSGVEQRGSVTRAVLILRALLSRYRIP